jgi:hypothetical protein
MGELKELLEFNARYKIHSSNNHEKIRKPQQIGAGLMHKRVAVKY